MTFLGLSLLTWQTLLLLGFPLILGSLSKIPAVLLFIRHPFKSPQSSPSNNNRHTEPPPPPRRYWRLHSLFLGLLLLGHSLLNVPSTTLAASLERYYRGKGLKETPYEQERLIRKLNTLDARLLFSTLGPDAFLGCSWCRPPSSKASGSDHLYFVLSRLVLEYACLLLAIGLMTTGASQPKTKRRLWRGRLALMSVFLLSSMGTGRMTWDSLFTIRSALFPLFVLAAWWAVVSEPPRNPLSPSAKLGLGLAALAADLDGLVNRLRLAALQRTALMKDGHYRSRTQLFWEKVESQATQASSTAAIQTMKDKMGLSASEKKNHAARDHLRNWIDTVYPDPSSASSPSSANSPTM
ncbi:hypothetical protein VP01_203g10 [Puccinia sorghi]|uniref:Transmembrane protein n=1 Tax=Puccinia sorghi TaxID=27349 RepID=A0A0L6VBJ9_9BASI|nr:hypothetical protein VP01_203g10 [Puccinia sorghi]